MDYLITMLGEFPNEDVVKDINLSLSPIIDSNHLKFHFTETSIISHFSSELSLAEISSYLKDALYSKVELVIVSPSEKTAILANDVFIEHLSNLEEPTENVEMSIDMEKVRKGYENLQQELMKLEDEDEDDEDEIQTIIERANCKEPTIDDLLDKINDYGYKSLTEKEQKLLQKLSK